MGDLRLDTPCAGVVVWFVMCTELYFHARDTYGALHMEPSGARLGFMRTAFARLNVGMDSDGQAVPDPIDQRHPRAAGVHSVPSGARPDPTTDALGGGRGPAE